MQRLSAGERAELGTARQVRAELGWRGTRDLDLLIFYRARDGRTGVVHGGRYGSASPGDLNVFPHVALGRAGAPAAGAGASAGEAVSVARADELEELFLVVVDATALRAGRQAPFGHDDLWIEVRTERGAELYVAGEGVSEGVGAGEGGGEALVLARLSAGFLGLVLEAVGRRGSLAALVAELPGGGAVDTTAPRTLATPGERTRIRPEGGEIVIGLSWDRGSLAASSERVGWRRWLLGPATGAARDLDLGVLFELTDGRKAAIQPLGEFLGSFERAPWIVHSGDARHGGASEGEHVRVNLAAWDRIARILAYTYIYEGAPRWDQTSAVATLDISGAPSVEVHVGRHARPEALASLALIENDGGDVLVTHCVAFFRGQEECDRHFGFGLPWVSRAKGG